MSEDKPDVSSGPEPHRENSVQLRTDSPAKASQDKLETGGELCEKVDSSVTEPTTTKETIASDAFSQLVRGWETYVSNHKADPLQMLQGLHFGVSATDADTDLGYSTNGLKPKNPLAPSPFRHTHSTPLKSTSRSIYKEQDNDNIPPPIPLDPFQRASSTPHSFRQRSINSAFSALDKSTTSIYTPIGDSGSIHSAFGPVIYYAHALEDMERTSIEVTDTRIMEDDAETSAAPPRQRQGAASRAARFLSDVKVLRRKRRGGRAGKETPVESERSRDTSVTVITDVDYHPRDFSMLTQTTESSDLGRSKNEEDDVRPHMKVDSEPVVEVTGRNDESDPESSGKEEGGTSPPRYQSLDSDIDEEQLIYQKIETTLHSTSSPATVPSPSYQQIVDAPSPHPGQLSGETEKRVIRIKVSNNTSSPSPTTMAEGTVDSPGSGTARSASSAGHTTQATSLSSTTGPALTTVSETDREVMEANKEGKLLRHQSVNSSSTYSSTSPQTYLGCNESPVPLREGANVPADRFFRRPSSSSKRSIDSLSMSNTSSSVDSPSFVSYRSEEEEREDSPNELSLSRMSFSPAAGRPPRSPLPKPGLYNSYKTWSSRRSPPRLDGMEHDPTSLLSKPYVLRTIPSGELWDDVGEIPMRSAYAAESSVEVQEATFEDDTMHSY